MRDELTAISDMLSDEDPVRRAQIKMHKPLPKRFYKTVDIGRTDDGWTILLDGKKLKTPSKNTLRLPSEAAAHLLRAEWDDQKDVIQPTRMPATRLVNSALDGVAANVAEVLEDIVRFSGSDLLCYRAESPQSLVLRQNELWDPALEWAHGHLGSRFILAQGIVYQEQPAQTVEAFRTALQQHTDPLVVACLHSMTTLTGSAILTLAVVKGGIDAEQAWSLAHLDEDWNIEQWGTDEEQLHRRALRKVEYATSCAMLAACSQ